MKLWDDGTPTTGTSQRDLLQDVIPFSPSLPFALGRLRAGLASQAGNLSSGTGPCTQQGSRLALMFCCHRLEILQNFMLVFCKWGLMGQWSICVGGGDIRGGNVLTWAHANWHRGGWWGLWAAAWWPKCCMHVPEDCSAVMARPGPGPRLGATMVPHHRSRFWRWLLWPWPQKGGGALRGDLWEAGLVNCPWSLSLWHLLQY